MACTREICKCCNRPNPVVFTVSDKAWEAVASEIFLPSVLCIQRFTMYGGEKLVAWCRKIEFWPVSLRLHCEFSSDGVVI